MEEEEEQEGDDGGEEAMMAHGCFAEETWTARLLGFRTGQPCLSMLPRACVVVSGVVWGECLALVTW